MQVKNKTQDFSKEQRIGNLRQKIKISTIEELEASGTHTYSKHENSPTSIQLDVNSPTKGLYLSISIM